MGKYRRTEKNKTPNSTMKWPIKYTVRNKYISYQKAPCYSKQDILIIIFQQGLKGNKINQNQATMIGVTTHGVSDQQRFYADAE